MLNNEQTEQLVKSFLELIQAKEIKVFSLEYDLKKANEKIEYLKKEIEELKKGN